MRFTVDTRIHYYTLNTTLAHTLINGNKRCIHGLIKILLKAYMYMGNISGHQDLNSYSYRVESCQYHITNVCLDVIVYNFDVECPMLLGCCQYI